MGFTKLDSGIVSSSIWSEPPSTRVVWITMLAMSNSEGMVRASASGIQRLSNVTEEECAHALETLQDPDIDSRSLVHEGRRIERVDGGWLILNYTKYREFTYADTPDAIRMRRKREEEKKNKGEHCSNSSEHSGTILNNLGHSASASVLNSDLIKGDARGIPEAELRIYALYPKKVGRGQAIRAIKTALKKISAEDLETAVKEYADDCLGKDPQYIPNPATWFNGERWLDENKPSTGKGFNEKAFEENMKNLKKETV